MLWGGIEAGGSKFVCAVGDDEGNLLAETTFPTTNPGETFSHTISFFQNQRKSLGTFESIGIASFGPLDLVKSSKRQETS